MPDTQEIVKRLREHVDSGRRTLGGGSISTDGKSTHWGGERIMIPANRDGEAAAQRIEALEKVLREIDDLLTKPGFRRVHMRNLARKALGGDDAE